MRGLFADISEERLCTEQFLPRIVAKIYHSCGLNTYFSCHRLLYTFCELCTATLRYAVPACAVCGKFSLRAETHADCKPKYPYYTAAVSVFDYTKVIKSLFAVYKYDCAFQYQRDIEQLIAKYVCEDPFLLLKHLFGGESTTHVVLFPVPMSSKKQENRGFSPAFEFAVIVGRALRSRFALQVTVCTGLVKKVGDVTSQARKDRRQRLLSLQKEYQIIDSSVAEFVQQQVDFFVVVDDVVTTGATTTAVLETIMKNQNLREKLRNTPIIRFSFARA